MTSRASAAALALLVACISTTRAATDDPLKDVDCKTASVQIELNNCADRQFQASDKKLNVLYRKLLEAAGPKERELLKSAERNWLNYRDSECEYENAPDEGGSIAHWTIPTA